MKKFVSVALIAAMLLTALTFISCSGKKDDTKFTNVPSMTYLYNTSDAHKAIGEYLQSALAAAGITMNLDNQEWNTFLNTRKDGQYTVARNGWLADYNDPICFLDMWTTASGNNDVQFGKGAHKDLAMYNLDLTPFGGEKIENGTWAQTYDVLISMIKGCTDNNNRYAMMHLAEDMLMDTGCIVPLYYYTDLYMVSKDVTGFFSNPLGYKYFMNAKVGDKTDNIAVCIASEPDTIDPALNSAVDGATLVSHLFSGLAKWDLNADGKLIIVADAAEALPEGTVADDGKVTYTYTLKQGLKWSDGQDVKASDFVFAWNRAASAALGADYGYMFEVVDGYADVAEGKDGAVLNAVADDDANTITITLANAVAYWNELLAFPTYFPVRADVVADEKWATEAASYVCNGAYTIASWDHNSKITLKKNANYVDAKSVTMEQIEFYLSDDSNNMLANFKTGDWKLIDDVPTNEIATLKKDFPDEFKIAGQIGTYYVCFNINENLLPADSTLTGVEAEKANAEIRKAMALMFDRNYIVEEIAQGGQLPASSFVAMGMTDADGTEFYKNAGTSDTFDGYYDVSTDAFEDNYNAAIETLKKYYTAK